jgi:stage III sporulation protein AF
MEWITLWLKQVILVVMLAAFLDLILPATQLQRYVKMVMGLIILLTILTPLFRIFQLSPDEMAMRISRYQAELSRSPRMPDWKAIAEQLKNAQDEQTENNVKRQMEQSIRQEIKEVHQMDVASVDVTFDRSANGQAEIKRIVIRLGQLEEGSTADAIQPVEPVRIDLDGDDEETSDTAAVTTQPENRLHQSIRETVAARWDVGVDRVNVIGAKEDAVRQ